MVRIVNPDSVNSGLEYEDCTLHGGKRERKSWLLRGWLSGEAETTKRCARVTKARSCDGDGGWQSRSLRARKPVVAVDRSWMGEGNEALRVFNQDCQLPDAFELRHRRTHRRRS